MMGGRFRWTLYKTLQFLHNRRPDLEIRANFFNQLLALESRLSSLGMAPKTYNWDEIDEEGLFREEEVILRNTYLNGQQKGIGDFKDVPKNCSLKIKWLDRATKDKLQTEFIPPYHEIDFQSRPHPSTKGSWSAVPITKGSRKESQQKSVNETQQESSILPKASEGGKRVPSMKQLEGTPKSGVRLPAANPGSGQKPPMQQQKPQVNNFVQKGQQVGKVNFSNTMPPPRSLGLQGESMFNRSVKKNGEQESAP